LNAACTIVAKNYLAFARTLCHSYLQNHPGDKFYVLIIDPVTEQDDFSQEEFEVVQPSQIGIGNYLEFAFTFDILELSTNVKPSLLKWLLQEKKVDKLLYVDPDICFYSPADELFEKLDIYSIVLTPHCVCPIMDNLRPSEQDFLKNGVFNLGFIAVRSSDDAFALLDWWERRCLELGFNEPASGLFVDQKWINFVPCFFDSVLIFKNPGYNMAYWNLHERRLSNKGDRWQVNESSPLVFFHFSGIDVNNNGEQISKHQNRFTLRDRPDMAQLFYQYKQMVLNNGFEALTRNYSYAYGSYSNGRPISALARRMFAAYYPRFSGRNPFAAEGDFYKWANRKGLIGKLQTVKSYNTLNYDKTDYRLQVIHTGLRWLIKIVGVEKYTLLMQYLGFISILRRQTEVFQVQESKHADN
jgi:hypothetical protein